VAAVLNAYGRAVGALPSDGVSTEFTLDLMATSVVLRLPGLTGARLRADGLLVPDPQRPRVAITLPRIRLRFAQGSAAGSPLTFDLLSLGASGLDDPGDLGVAELISMDPPYAPLGRVRAGFVIRP
jgi:hypothetical protein